MGPNFQLFPYPVVIGLQGPHGDEKEPGKPVAAELALQGVTTARGSL